MNAATTNRVVTVLEGEITRLDKQNEVLNRDIKFYLERVDAYRATLADNHSIIRELQSEIVQIIHRNCDSMDREALAEAGRKMMREILPSQIDCA